MILFLNDNDSPVSIKPQICVGAAAEPEKAVLFRYETASQTCLFNITVWLLQLLKLITEVLE